MENSKKSSAEHVDTHRRLLFISFLLLSLIFGIKAGIYFGGEEINKYLSIAAKVLAFSVLVTLSITVYWKLRYIPSQERFYLLTSPDNFVNQVMNRAIRISWQLTFILLMLIMVTTGRNDAAMPAEFYLDLTAFFMLFVFSISFFILFRTDDNEMSQKSGV